MTSGKIDWARPPLARDGSGDELDLQRDPLVASAHLLACGLIEICGPLFWGALAVGWFFAEFSGG